MRGRGNVGRENGAVRVGGIVAGASGVEVDSGYTALDCAK